MIYTIYKDHLDEIKYKPIGKTIKNVSEKSYLLGETAMWRFILEDAKQTDEKTVGIFQARRMLCGPAEIHPDKIYHTSYYVNGNNIGLWQVSHPTAANSLIEACNVIVALYPEYVDTVNMVLRGNILFPHNMWIMPIERFEEYINFYESVITNMKLPADPPKIGSLLSERLFTIWSLHNIPLKDHVFLSAIAFDKNTGDVINNVDAVAD